MIRAASRAASVVAVPYAMQFTRSLHHVHDIVRIKTEWRNQVAETLNEQDANAQTYVSNEYARNVDNVAEASFKTAMITANKAWESKMEAHKAMIEAMRCIEQTGVDVATAEEAFAKFEFDVAKSIAELA